MIALSHVGEIVVAEMINRSASVRDSIFGSLNLDTVIAVPEVRLNPCGGLNFDGAHKIDIAILDTKNKVCIPVEAKLGENRLTAGEFNKRFLSECGTSHKGSRVKGNMISILERNLPNQCKGSNLTVTYSNATYSILNEWYLICRESVLEKWKKSRFPDLSQSNSQVSIESIINAFGGKDVFNKLVRELLDIDYHDKWLGQSG